MRLAGGLALMLAAALPFRPPPMLAAETTRFAVPPAAATGDGSVAGVALTFQVSVCLDDFEYSIACRERSSLEAAHRLEQIFFDDFTTGIPGGMLRIWFAVKAEPSEQENFLREVEVRAIEAAYRKFKEKADQWTAAAGAPDTPITTVEAAQKFAQDIERWHNDAGGEARSGSNWLHEWSARSHSYKAGPALHDLARIGNRNRDQNGSPVGSDLEMQASDMDKSGPAVPVVASTPLTLIRDRRVTPQRRAAA
jgi:hypothetical protein